MRFDGRKLTVNRFLLLCLLSLGVTGCLEPVSEEAMKKKEQAPSTEDPNFVAKPAEVGVGIQGRSLQNDKGIDQMITAPAATLFKVKEKVVFEIQIPQAMNLYQAEKGYFPRTHEEFMEIIIDFNRIKLPKLPDGQMYRYHPDDHTLWVEPMPKE